MLPRAAACSSGGCGYNAITPLQYPPSPAACCAFAAVQAQGGQAQGGPVQAWSCSAHSRPSAVQAQGWRLTDVEGLEDGVGQALLLKVLLHRHVACSTATVSLQYQ